MRKLIFILALVGCSDDKPTPDASIAAPVAQDCTTYCNEIQTNCTGANAQYAATGMTNCMATCASFPPGTADDKAGQNTLGCRIYHAGMPAATDPATHCPHAGPGGDKIGVAAPGTCGDACTSFCTLEIKACGVKGDAGGNGQYTGMADCMSSCAAFPNADKLYSPTSHGDSLACRLYHATNAAISGNAMTHCPHTAAMPTGATNPCLAGSPATP